MDVSGFGEQCFVWHKGNEMAVRTPQDGSVTTEQKVTGNETGYLLSFASDSCAFLLQGSHFYL